MDCPICLEGLGDSAISLPCGKVTFTAAPALRVQRKKDVLRAQHAGKSVPRSGPIPGRLSVESLQANNARLFQELSNETRLRKEVSNKLAFERSNFAWDVQAMNRETQNLRQEMAGVNHEISRWINSYNNACMQLQFAKAQFQAKERELASSNARVREQDEEIDRLRKELQAQKEVNETRELPYTNAHTITGPPEGFRTPPKHSYSRMHATDTRRNFATPDPTPPCQVEEVFAQSEHAGRRIAGRGRVIKRAAQSSTPDVYFAPTAEDTAQDTEVERPATPSPPPKTVLYWGSDIKWRGYGCPMKTGVPACSSRDGYHDFSGKGTNGSKKRYTCKICSFWCSE
ncbi:hypothetical protein BKA70DRAFT_1402402 [Coprinopsis sp. MPI-PUGE-AT-0042]|nr:hypothetical protein BKA70DRAFT_1402402 [Coprinopsis sp. MPI-PUGE-AT-0042]